MGVTSNPNDPGIRKIQDNGQQEKYLTLSKEELAKGYVAPVRLSYIHLACGTATRMPVACAETYARDPKFYSGTFCCHCRQHFALFDSDGIYNFVWEGDETPVGFTPEEAKAFLEKRRQQEANKNLGSGI